MPRRHPRRRGLTARIDDESDVPARPGRELLPLCTLATRRPRAPPFWQRRNGPVSGRARIDRDSSIGFAIIANRESRAPRARRIGADFHATSALRADGPLAAFLSALLAIVVIDLVLAGDNAIVIALAARSLPPASAEARDRLGRGRRHRRAQPDDGDRRLAAPDPGPAARRRPAAALDRLPAAAARGREPSESHGAGAGDLLGRDADDRRRRRGDGARQRARRRRRGARQLPARGRRASSSACRSSSGAARSCSRSSIASRRRLRRRRRAGLDGGEDDPRRAAAEAVAGRDAAARDCCCTSRSRSSSGAGVRQEPSPARVAHPRTGWPRFARSCRRGHARCGRGAADAVPAPSPPNSRRRTPCAERPRSGRRLAATRCAPSATRSTNTGAITSCELHLSQRAAAPVAPRRALRQPQRPRGLAARPRRRGDGRRGRARHPGAACRTRRTGRPASAPRRSVAPRGGSASHHIVMGTARKNSITRMLEDSVTHRVLETTPVPVEVIAGDAVSQLGALGPAGRRARRRRPAAAGDRLSARDRPGAPARPTAGRRA